MSIEETYTPGECTLASLVVSTCRRREGVTQAVGGRIYAVISEISDCGGQEGLSLVSNDSLPPGALLCPLPFPESFFSTSSAAHISRRRLYSPMQELPKMITVLNVLLVSSFTLIIGLHSASSDFDVLF